jgi:hypothetical protein
MPSWVPTEIDSGWATLIAAIIGVMIVSWQARLGFQSVIKAQRQQAELDRDARIHQAELAKQEQIAKEKTTLKTLSSALSGELSAATTALGNSVVAMQMQKAIFEQVGDDIPPFEYDAFGTFPKLETKIFDANIRDLGLLGPSTASDVVEVYQFLNFPRGRSSTSALTGKLLAAALDAQIAAIRSWQKDTWHVQRRLLSNFGSGEDPGPLYFERERRQKESEGSNVA